MLLALNFSLDFCQLKGKILTTSIGTQKAQDFKMASQIPDRLHEPVSTENRPLPPGS